MHVTLPRTLILTADNSDFLKLSHFDGNVLNQPERLSTFLATVDSRRANSSSEKMKYLKNLVTRKTDAAISGMGYLGGFNRSA